MKKFLEKYPVPISGLALGMAALGNLLKSYGETPRNLLGIIAFVIILLLTVKILSNIEGFKKAMESPVISGSFATYSMVIIILSAYLPNKSVGIIFWYIGILIHVLLIIWFSIKYIPKRNIETVFTTWFIVYVGIVTVSVTAPWYKMPAFGKAAFWFGFVTYIVLLPIVLYRVLKVKKIPEPAIPTFAVFAAPAALLLAGYISSFPEKNFIIFNLLIFLTTLFYVTVLISMLKLLKLKFYPSFSAFTFPLVISGLALKLMTDVFKKAGVNVSVLAKVVNLAEIIALVAVIYVFVKYLQFIFQKEQIEK
ncbi:MAG: TDT family transporter [Pseudoleptotrichia goodfellowii]|nr:TDT family transporter [Pseudoleptotrichia goodfellowii]